MFNFFNIKKKENTVRDIDLIIEAVKKEFPDVGVWQIQVTNPNDDDGIWYFWLGEINDDEIQIDSSDGNCPFYTSTFRSDEMITVNSIEETVNLVCEHLRTSKYNK